tara:strand:- start:553 stop:723 length:171 start_codon:yes stop_codon:yes gene_type:complete
MGVSLGTGLLQDVSSAHLAQFLVLFAKSIFGEVVMIRKDLIFFLRKVTTTLVAGIL